MSQSPFHLDLIGTFRVRGNLRFSFLKLKFFPILRLNPAEFSYNPAECSYNPAECSYNPAECSYNSQSLRLEIKVVTKDIVSLQQGLKSDKCTCTIKVFNVYWSSV